MAKKMVTRAELERLVRKAAAGRPTIADVEAVTIGLRPSEDAADAEWFVAAFERRRPPPDSEQLDDEAVAAELHALADRLREVYAVAG
jgi:hypothetical protein